MPKRERAPQIAEVSASDHKSRKRKIKRLVHLRQGYGKSAWYDTTTHQPRYPIDEIAPALFKFVRKAVKVNRDPDLSIDEKDLWEQMFKVLVIALAGCLLFYTDLDSDGVPDFFEFLNHLLSGSMSIVQNNDEKQADPDFIEKGLGLEDDAIEKNLGLPAHTVEKFCCPIAEKNRLKTGQE